MTEREYTVIRTLENKIAIAENNNQNILFVTRDVLKEILVLLKDQEAIPPYRVNTNYQQHWKCGGCSTVIKPEDKFCCACGKRIDWEMAVK